MKRNLDVRCDRLLKMSTCSWDFFGKKVKVTSNSKVERTIIQVLVMWKYMRPFRLYCFLMQLCSWQKFKNFYAYSASFETLKIHILWRHLSATSYVFHPSMLHPTFYIFYISSSRLHLCFSFPDISTFSFNPQIFNTCTFKPM